MRNLNTQRQYMAHRQKGLSLIELMISMVLGLIVISALFNIFAGTKRSSEFSDGLMTMQENGRFGIATLQQSLRLAGFSSDSTTVLPPFDIAAGSESSIVVQKMASFDCNGISTAAVGGIAVNTYSFDEGNSIISCRGNSDKASDMTLIEGVDGFRVLYGMARLSTSDADRYVSYDESIDPALIKSIRVAILVNSMQPIRSRRVEETHIVLDEEIKKDDLFARNVFTTTILLRNGG